MLAFFLDFPLIQIYFQVTYCRQLWSEEDIAYHMTLSTHEYQGGVANKVAVVLTSLLTFGTICTLEVYTERELCVKTVLNNICLRNIFSSSSFWKTL